MGMRYRVFCDGFFQLVKWMKKRFTGFSAMDKEILIDSVHTRTMKIVLSTKDPRLRASL